MDPIAIAKAQTHYDRAFSALAEMTAAHSFEVFEEAWAAFLSEYGRFMGKLEKGAKANPKSRQWYGEFKNWCRKDSLASYLHQARNAEEHGLLDTTVRVADAAITKFPNTNTVHTSFMLKVGPKGIETRDIKTVTPDGEYLPSEALNARVELDTVYDERFPGQSWTPPLMHKDLPIVDRSPRGAALLGLNLMENTLTEAKSRVP